MLIFNSAEIGTVDPNTLFIFPTVLSAQQEVALWAVAATWELTAHAPFRGDATIGIYNIMGLFPCVDLAVSFARLFEKGEFDKVDVEGATYGDSVH